MYFSRITLNPKADTQRLAEMLCSNTYKEHQTLWRFFEFDPGAKRDFLYRQVIENGRIKYYLLSERQPVQNSDMWLTDPPKKYNPQLKIGQSFLFMLRANPVVTVVTEKGKRQRHDIVMHHKTEIDYKHLSKNERPSLPQIVHESGINWLSARAKNNGFCFSPEAVVADGYNQHRNHGKAREKSIRYSTVDFQGVLTVTAPELFRKALYSGIGKAKAFGCGLMLIRRI